jgi:hypothetical protein
MIKRGDFNKFFNFNRLCLFGSCHTSCLTCDGSKENNCISCDYPLFLIDKYCKATCPSGTYPNYETYTCE